MQKKDPDFTHRTVLPTEVVDLLSPVSGGVYVDATLGLGGHSEAILEFQPLATVIGIDQDSIALKMAGKRLERFGARFKSVKANFSEISDVIDSKLIDGIVADLGVSSMQLDDATRGFSFRFDAPLDMRMDTESESQTAAELLEDTNEEELANIIYQFGEERRSRKIARWIGERNRRGEPLKTTKELADLVAKAIGWKPKDKIHPATRTFQALRIAVNGELDILDKFLTDSVNMLKTNGVLAVITFHSLEDRIVKHTFQRLAGKCSCPPRLPICICGAEKRVEIITRKPILPGEDELNVNPRSRSAKLRACRRLDPVTAKNPGGRK